MNESRADTLIQEINALKTDFQNQFEELSEIKWLQGVERCVELKMKVWGFDGKQTPAEVDPTPAPGVVLDLNLLSTETLAEILALLHEKEQPQKPIKK